MRPGGGPLGRRPSAVWRAPPLRAVRIASARLGGQLTTSPRSRARVPPTTRRRSRRPGGSVRRAGGRRRRDQCDPLAGGHRCDGAGRPPPVDRRRARYEPGPPRRPRRRCPFRAGRPAGPPSVATGLPGTTREPRGYDEAAEPYGPAALARVGVAGFEPTASSSRTKRATKLRHTPVPFEYSLTLSIFPNGDGVSTRSVVHAACCLAAWSPESPAAGRGDTLLGGVHVQQRRLGARRDANLCVA